jgi:hypothetical protein
VLIHSRGIRSSWIPNEQKHIVHELYTYNDRSHIVVKHLHYSNILQYTCFIFKLDFLRFDIVVGYSVSLLAGRESITESNEINDIQIHSLLFPE